MKRQVIISGDFTVTEVSDVQTGTTAMPVASKKAQQRIDALRAAGVSVDNFFAMGDNMIVKVVDGIPSLVEDDDPVFQEISRGGYVCHYRLFRRWVMAQMFRYLRHCKLYNRNMVQVINGHGYEYQWKMVEKELLDQYKMAKHGDTECFDERNVWFNKTVVNGMALDYVNELRKYVDSRIVYKSKGREYKRLGGGRVYLDNIEDKFFAPVVEAVSGIVNNSPTAQALYENVRHFNKVRMHFHNDAPKMSGYFVEAYKGAGGYFTCKNLILFHGCRVHKDGRILSQEQSLAELRNVNRENLIYMEGWRMIGFMKELIQDNNISVEGKIAEWSK